MKKIALLFLVLVSCSPALPFNGRLKSEPVKLNGVKPPMQCVMVEGWTVPGSADNKHCWCSFGPIVIPTKVSGPTVVVGFLLAQNEYCSKGFVLPGGKDENL